MEINGCICTGRADYALGYPPRVRALETFLMVIEAKATLVLSTATAQALFYLGEKECLLFPEEIGANNSRYPRAYPLTERLLGTGA